MRFVTLAALAFSGAVDMASAGPCKPRAPTGTSSAGVFVSETSSAGATMSGTASAGVPMSETSVAVDATTLPEPPVNSIIENSVTGGGMTSLDPFALVGDVKINNKDGFRGDGSPDTSAAELTAPTSPIRKRQNEGGVAAIKQMLTNLNVRTQYTVQFYYYLRNTPQQTTSCILEAFIGSQKFYTTGLFFNGASTSYNQVLVSTSVPVSQGFLNIQTTCASGSSAAILIDSIFISNQVSVENIRNYRLDFGNGVIREPTNLPATTQRAQVPATQDGAATATEVAGEGTTTASGNGNSAEPTTAPQVDATNQPTQPGSDEATSAGDNSGKPTTVAQNGQETETAGSKPTTFVGTESLETTSAGANSEQSTTVAGNVQSTQAVVIESQSTLAQTQSENIQTTSVGENSARSTTAASNVQSTQTVTAQAQSTSVQIQSESSESTSVHGNSEHFTTTAGSEQSTTQSVGTEAQPTFAQTQSESLPTTTGEDSVQSTIVAGNEKSTQSVGNEAQTTTSAGVKSSESTAAGETSAQSTTVNDNEQGTTQAASAESPLTFAPTQSDSSDATSSAAGSVGTNTESVGTETESASVQSTQTFSPGVTETKSFVTTTRPAETESNSPAAPTDSAAEETYPSTTTTGFPTEETITPIQDAQPVQEDCLGQNLIDNGDFEHAGDGWEMYGNAAITYNGQFGPNSRTNSGQSAVAIRWPQANGVRAAFKRTIPNLIPGMPYLFGWAYHVASGEGLPDNMCTITATFDNVASAPFDPFSVSDAWTNYRNIMNHVFTPDTEVEVVFELSCSGNPRPFTVIVDDVFLAACQK
jgi:hypothetical protein